MINKKFCRSPLNYSGNKFRVLDKLENIFDILDKDYVFVDVFGGSGVVSANVNFNNIIYNEVNVKLFEIVKLLNDEDPKQIIESIEKIINEYSLIIPNSNNYRENKYKYLKLRDDYNNNNNNLYMLIVLILFGFNSQIRFNSNNKFNIPVGKSGMTDYRKNNIILFSNKIKNKNIEFYNSDYKDLINNNINNKKCFFFLDPPYLVSNATYNNEWNIEKELELINYLQLFVDENIKFVLTNFLYNGNKVNTILEEFINKNNSRVSLVDLNTNYSGSNYNRKDSKTREVIVFNF